VQAAAALARTAASTPDIRTLFSTRKIGGRRRCSVISANARAHLAAATWRASHIGET